MKKIMYYLFVVIIALSFSYKETLGQNVYKREFNVENAGKTYKLENDTLTIAVNNLSKYDVVAIEPTFVSRNAKLKPFTLKAWEISYNQDNVGNSPIRVSKLDNIVPIENSSSFDKGVLTVNSLSSGSNKRSVAHIALPTGVNVKLYVDGALLHNGSLSGEGLMFQNGESLTSSKGYSAEAALSQAVIGRNDRSAPTSYKRVDWQTLSTLVKKSVTTPTAFSDKGENWALLQVDVDESGRVRNLLYAGGNEALAVTSKQFLTQYEFKPFLVDDKPVRVKSLIPVSVVKGQIKLFSEGK